MSKYNYFTDSSAKHRTCRNSRAALDLGRQRFDPALNNPDYLILRSRTRYFRECLDSVSADDLQILDVGGRVQPYRDMLESRTKLYLAIDPQLEGLADVIGIVENLPFPTEKFDFVICTQVLSYVGDPLRAISEMHRVLKPGGYLFVSVPANCPQFHSERWRFLHEGINVLLEEFSHVDIYPEVHSLGGAFRTINKILDQTDSAIVKSIASRALIPLLNVLGRRFDKHVFRSEFLTSNYSAFAQK